MLRNLVLGLIVLFSIAACNKKDSVGPLGGKGGTGKILVTPVYNGSDFGKLPVYLKWNNLRPEGCLFLLRYDDTAYCNQLSGKPTAIFENLKPGEYWAHVNGIDSNNNSANPYYGNKFVVLKEGETLTIDLNIIAY